MEARKQLNLFDTPAPTPTFDPTPTDPHVAAADRPRLAGQNAVILHLLQMGPCTNVELAQVSLKYTSRVSDLRAAGYRVRCERAGGGVTRYWLEE